MTKRTLLSVSIFAISMMMSSQLVFAADVKIFSDVETNHPNIYAIEFLSENDVINGYPDGTFKPAITINRAELMKIVVFGQGLFPTVEEYNNCFKDVKDEWFAPAICYAHEQGWVKGYDDGNFRPSQNVNMVEALKIIEEAYGMPYAEVKDHGLMPANFTGQWYTPYLVLANEFGILGVAPDKLSTINPSSQLSRGTTAEYLYRTISLEFYKDKYSSVKWKSPETGETITDVTSFSGLVIGVEYGKSKTKPEGDILMWNYSITDDCKYAGVTGDCFRMDNYNAGAGFSEFQVIGDQIFYMAESEDSIDAVYSQPYVIFTNHNSLQYIRPDEALTMAVGEDEINFYDFIKYTEYLGTESVDTEMGEKEALKYEEYVEIRGDLSIAGEVVDAIYIVENIKYVVDGLGEIRSAFTISLLVELDGEWLEVTSDTGWEQMDSVNGEQVLIPVL